MIYLLTRNQRLSERTLPKMLISIAEASFFLSNFRYVFFIIGIQNLKKKKKKNCIKVGER